MHSVLSPAQYGIFGFFIEDIKDISEVVTEHNFKTFKTRYSWRDQHNFLWNRVGLYIFDFRGHYGFEPRGELKLTRDEGEMRIELTCMVERAMVNNRDNMGGSANSNTSVCGRGVLSVKSYSIGPAFPKLPAPPRAVKTLEDLFVEPAQRRTLEEFFSDPGW